MSYILVIPRFSVTIDSQGVALRRRAHGLTQAQLAELAGVSRQTLTEIEGDNYNPSAALALRLAILLDSRVEELFRLPEQDVRALIARRDGTLIDSGGEDHGSA